MAHKQYVDYKKNYEPFKNTQIENVRQNNKSILSKIIDKKIEIKSSYSPLKREYFVNEIKDIFVENSAGKLIPAFKLINNKLSDDKQIIINSPTSLIEEKKNLDNTITLILNYEHEINFETGFKHLHKQNQPSLKISIKII